MTRDREVALLRNISVIVTMIRRFLYDIDFIRIILAGADMTGGLRRYISSMTLTVRMLINTDITSNWFYDIVVVTVVYTDIISALSLALLCDIVVVTRVYTDIISALSLALLCDIVVVTRVYTDISSDRRLALLCDIVVVTRVYTDIISDLSVTLVV